MRAGANILSPIIVNQKYPPGTVVDYAYSVFYQDRKIAHTPYHALTATERECYNARREMLDHLGDLLRTQVLNKEKELIEKQLKEVKGQAEGTQNVDKSLQSTWGILKSSDRLSRLREHDTSPAEKRHALKCSRVSFRLENEVSGEDDGEAHEIEAQADREVEAITGIDGESPGMDNEQEKDHMTSEMSPAPDASKESTPCSLGSSAPEPSLKPQSPGRDENCGLRIAVTKAADHMSISALATQTLKQRKQVMKNRFRYCYECGRSIAIRLSACTRCKEVFYCSKSCKLKAWNARHREECVRLTGGGMKTTSNRRAESPTPTTDPDVPPPSTTPSGSQRKAPSRGKGEKVRKPQTVSASRVSKRNSSPSATKFKK